jgi:CheY-like chemotaxis protein
MLLGQVLLNLAVNARDAMPDGGHLTIETDEHLRTKAELQLRPAATHDRYVRLRITDTGCGIPSDVMPRIFEPFFTTKPSGKGTGLGLATVFGIVEQHGGWITVDSHTSSGTSFQIYLPAVAAPAPSATESTPQPRLDGTETILFAEDEPAVRLATQRVLESHGYRVLSAEEGQAALDLFHQHQATISLLLTDLVMPGNLGGQELARLIQSEKPDLRVVFITGYSSNLVGRSLTLGPHQHFLQKPFPPESLLIKLRSALDA